MRRFVRKHAVALIAIAAFHFVLFFPVLFMQRVVSPNDVFWNTDPWAALRHVDVQNSQLNDPPTSYLTLMALARSGLRTFHWNPCVASGIPGWGSSAAAVLSPFIFLPALLVPWAWIWTAILFLKINASFWFTYLWLREERLGRRAAAIGAIVFAAAGPFAVRWMWQVTNATVLYPALLWIVCRTARGKRTPVSIVALIALAYALSGFPSTMAYGAWVAEIYAVYKIAGAGRRRTGRLVAGAPIAGVLIAVAIALPSLIPMIQFVRRTGYLGVREQAALRSSFPRSHWRAFIAPNYLGNPAYHNWSGDRKLGVLNNYVEATVYVGLLTIPLVLLSIVRRRWFWIVALAVILAAMFGAPGLAPLIAKVPGVKYSSLARLQLVLPVAVAYLAAAGASVIARRRWVAALIALAIAGDLGVFAGRFHPYLSPSETFIPRTPTIRFLQNDYPAHFRVAPFMNYLWPNSAELFGIEDVRSHFSSEAMYRRLLQRIDPTSWGGYSTVIQFDSRSFNFADPLVGMLGIRYFLEHRSIDIIRWTTYSHTVPGVKEVGAIRLLPGATLRRTIRVDAEPFYAIELPVNVEQTTNAHPRLNVILLKGTTLVWYRFFTPADLGAMNKVYIPLRPFARLGESVTLVVQSDGIRGSVLRGEGAAANETPLFFGRVTTPVIFDRELPDGRIFRNVAEVPRFHAVAALRKMTDEQFLAARDVDFEREAIITDPAAPLPETSDASVKVIRMLPDEQVIRGNGAAPYFIASSEKRTPELRVTVDGRPAKPVTINGLFAGVSVPAGDHTVVFSRRLARGWWWVSVVGVVALIAAAIADFAATRMIW